MKIVLDTNIFISGIHWSLGDSGKIIEAWLEDKFELIISESILEELAKTLKFFKKPMTDDEILHWISIIAVDGMLVRPERKIEIVKDDPDDDKFFEAAEEGKADYIVSQDKHLLKIREFRGIKVVKPEEFLEILGKK